MATPEATDPISAMRALYLEADAFCTQQRGEPSAENPLVVTSTPDGLLISRYGGGVLSVSTDFVRHSDGAIEAHTVTFPADFASEDSSPREYSALPMYEIRAPEGPKTPARRKFPGLVAELRKLLPEEIGDLVGTRT